MHRTHLVGRRAVVHARSPTAEFAPSFVSVPANTWSRTRCRSGSGSTIAPPPPVENNVLTPPMASPRSRSRSPPQADSDSHDASAAPRAPGEQPPVPPPAAAAPKSRKTKHAITATEKELAALRQRRTEMSKQLAAIRKETKEARRRVSALNKKASKTSLADLMGMALLKVESLRARGEIDDAAAGGPSAASGSASDAMPATLSAFALLARAHASAEAATTA